ncbi:MAG TPA: helix-turn-helix transcriptional regulator [Abditibacteriaceae bacterium]
MRFSHIHLRLTKSPRYGWFIIESVYQREYQILLLHLRETRRKAGLTQEDVAARVRWERTVITKIESGVRRIDAIELRAYVNALGYDFEAFVHDLEIAIRLTKNATP